MSTWEILEGDCLERLRELPSASVDAVVTDPPYCSGSVSEASRSAAKGQGLRSENLTRFGWFTGDNMGTAGLVFLLRSVAFECVRVMKPTGSMLVFCDWRMFPSIAPAIESAGLRYQNLVVWDKGNAGLGTGFRAQHELVLHFTNGSPEYHDRSAGNVLRCRRVGALDREHQTQKPLELMQRVLRVVAPAGGAVLDPFAGSGTTGAAALSLGMSFFGIEREPQYVEIARRRCAHAAETRQPELFDEVP